MDTRSLRVAVGGIWHESNTFAAGATELDAFHAYQFAEGAALRERYRDTNTEPGGAIAACADLGITLVPTLYAAAVPGPVITHDAFETLLGRLIEALRASAPVDAVLLCLHGAAVAADHPEADAVIVARVREVVGADTPIGATFDLHANLGERLVDETDLLVGYDTFPHIDMFNRGDEAIRLLADICRSGRRPAGAHCKLPLLTVPQVQATDAEPLRRMYAALHALEADGSILCGSIALGFPYADVPALGASVLAYAESRPAARAGAETIAAALWRQRHAFNPELWPVEEAVQRALASPEKPVVLVDPADNVGGGSPGDGTRLLAALLDAGARNAVAVLCDAQAAQQAAAAGAGGHFHGAVGGRTDEFHGDPLPIDGRVVRVEEASYRHSGPYMRGIVTSMGLTAVIACRGNFIVITSRRTMPFDIEQLRCLDIEPAERDIIVVKSALAWRAAYGPIARNIVYADTPGVCSSNLSRFDYSQQTGPLYPLQEPVDFACRSIRGTSGP